jgi:hypothetical protein
MSTIELYGASDDLIEVEGDIAGCDEYNADDAHFVLTGVDGSALWIRVWYTRRGVWAIALAPLDEDVPMLPASVTGDRYTAKAIVSGVCTVVREAA